MKQLLMIGLVALSACAPNKTNPADTANTVVTATSTHSATVSTDMDSCLNNLTSNHSKHYHHSIWESHSPDDPTENFDTALEATKQYLVSRGCKVEHVDFWLSKSSCLNKQVCYIEADVGTFYIHSLYDNWTSVLYNHWD